MRRDGSKDISVHVSTRISAGCVEIVALIRRMYFYASS